MPRLGDGLSGHNNSLNLLRLLLAAICIASHGIKLGGFGNEPFIHHTTPGTVALYGFFALSGYLIAQSALTSGFWRYAWKRSLRIFPGAWVCLLMTAFFFGVVGWFSGDHGPCAFSCYWHSTDNPVAFVYRNLPVPNAYSAQLSISGTPVNVPEPGVWNGQMWTLFYELLCYLLLGLLAVVGVLRSKVMLLCFFAAFWLFDAAITFNPVLHSTFNYFGHSEVMNLFKFGSVFFLGSVLFVFREKIPDSGWIALALAILFFASLIYLPGKKQLTIAEIDDLFVPLIAYPVLWLGIHLPFGKIGRRNDLSFGFYIYGIPVAQLLTIWHLQNLGYVPYIAITIVATLPFAAASWFLIERPALSLKNLQLGSPSSAGDDGLLQDESQHAGG